MQKVNQEIYAKLIKFLMNNDATLSQIADKTGLHVITVGNLMQTFRKHKLVHICEWDMDRLGRDQTMVIRWGAGKDVKRFKMSGRDRQRLCRARKKAQVITHPVSLITPLSVGL